MFTEEDFRFLIAHWNTRAKEQYNANEFNEAIRCKQHAIELVKEFRATFPAHYEDFKDITG